MILSRLYPFIQIRPFWLNRNMTGISENIRNNTVRISVVGMGYVGLPLAVAFASAGLSVTGLDIQKKRVDSINRGISYIADINSSLLSKLVASKRLTATTDHSHTASSDAVLICVPTPLTPTKEPDLSYVTNEIKALSQHIRKGQLIVLESTTYPGTTRELVLPILEQSGLKAGDDFYLAYSPERVDPGSKKYSIKNTPKIVGGINWASTELACLIYGLVVDKVIPVSSPDVAEMSKIFENTFRSVNIALVNELALLCEKMNMSIWEVVNAASSKPFGFMPFYPSPGIGGHCIPLDPYSFSCPLSTRSST